MDGSRKWSWVFGVLFVFLGPARARATDGAAALVHPRVGAVTALSGMPDGSTREEIGNCILWTTRNRTYTLGDLHTVMTGEEGASGRVADEISVTVGKRSSRARIVWPPEGRRNVLEVDIAILELEDDRVGAEPFRPEDFQGAVRDLPGLLYLAAPGHRSQILKIEAPAVKYGSQWFLYRELSRGDSGGLVFAYQDGAVVPYGIVSSIGSLPGESVRGTAVYGRDALRIFINQFLQVRDRMASRP